MNNHPARSLANPYCKAVVLAVLAALLPALGHFVTTADADTNIGGTGGTEITVDNWGETVGFKPDLDSVPVKPGETVDKSNVDKVKGFIQPGLELLIKKYNLALKIGPYIPFRPSRGYIAATNANRGKMVLNDIGQKYRTMMRNDYFSGLPFPQPKTGVEVAANFDNRYMGDDLEFYMDVFWISAKSGVEHSEYWHVAWLNGARRTELDPKPKIKEFADKRVVLSIYNEALEPYDKKGFGILYTASYDPLDIQGHLYIPPLRRVLRHSFGTRGDSWNGTDLLNEDAFVYAGYTEWMNWKLEAKKTMLLPVHSGMKPGNDPKVILDLDHWPHWNPKFTWEPRPVYVLSATPKIPDYPYSRMLFLVDAESSIMYYKEAFDKKGKLWKIMLHGHDSPDPDSQPVSVSGVDCVIDLQAEHATCFRPRKWRANTGLNPKDFTVDALRKRGH